LDAWTLGRLDAWTLGRLDALNRVASSRVVYESDLISGTGVS
jgi:hypothetical protein